MAVCGESSFRPPITTHTAAGWCPTTGYRPRRPSPKRDRCETGSVRFTTHTKPGTRHSSPLGWHMSGLTKLVRGRTRGRLQGRSRKREELEAADRAGMVVRFHAASHQFHDGHWVELPSTRIPRRDILGPTEFSAGLPIEQNKRAVHPRSVTIPVRQATQRHVADTARSNVVSLLERTVGSTRPHALRLDRCRKGTHSS